MQINIKRISFKNYKVICVDILNNIVVFCVHERELSILPVL